MLDDQTDSSTPAVSVVPKEVEGGKAKIKNFTQWHRTWMIFMSVFLHFRPEFVSQLHSYQESISQLAATYFANNWLTYDANFRQKRANNPFLRWDVEDSALFIAYLRTAPVLASAALPLSTASTTHTTDSAVVSAVSRSSNPGTNSRPASGKRCYN